MFGPNLSKIFVPCWRDGRLLFFTTVKEKYTTRIEYIVAAATKPGSGLVERSGKSQITVEELKKCQETADDGRGLQQFFSIMGSGNIGHLVDQDLLKPPPCAGKANVLIYSCVYLDFLRKYSVDQSIVRRYEQAEVAERFDIGITLSVYRILSAHFQPERANELIDADIQDIRSIRGPSGAVANLLRSAAIIKFDVGDFSRAENMMLRAVKLHDTEDKWRWLADICNAGGNSGQAIEYFKRAEEIQPLAPLPALRLAKLLVADENFAQAEPFLERAATAFPKPVQKLRHQIEQGSSAR